LVIVRQNQWMHFNEWNCVGLLELQNSVPWGRHTFSLSLWSLFPNSIYKNMKLISRFFLLSL
jgi:hypothetical protein